MKSSNGKAFATLAVWAALALALGAGCSSEQLTLTLEVTASPNPVAGVDSEGGRTWDFDISITNPLPVGVRIEYFHVQTMDTDTGYSSPLVVVEDSAVIGQTIGPGATLSYRANRESGGKFTRGTERRLYHGRGEDGVYYSGEVVIELE
jgi:hypothetical protein